VITLSCYAQQSGFQLSIPHCSKCGMGEPHTTQSTHGSGEPAHTASSDFCWWENSALLNSYTASTNFPPWVAGDCH